MKKSLLITVGAVCLGLFCGLLTFAQKHEVEKINVLTVKAVHAEVQGCGHVDTPSGFGLQAGHRGQQNRSK